MRFGQCIPYKKNHMYTPTQSPRLPAHPHDHHQPNKTATNRPTQTPLITVHYVYNLCMILL